MHVNTIKAQGSTSGLLVKQQVVTHAKQMQIRHTYAIKLQFLWNDSLAVFLLTLLK